MISDDVGCAEMVKGSRLVTNIERSPAHKGQGTGLGDLLAVSPGTENELVEMRAHPEAAKSKVGIALFAKSLAAQ